MHKIVVYSPERNNPVERGKRNAVACGGISRSESASMGVHPIGRDCASGEGQRAHDWIGGRMSLHMAFGLFLEDGQLDPHARAVPRGRLDLHAPLAGLDPFADV